MDLEGFAAFMLYARDCVHINDVPIIECDKARHELCSLGLQYRINRTLLLPARLAGLTEATSNAGCLRPKQK
jgi:hypothetical protein